MFIPTINKAQALDYTKCRRTVFSAVVQLITGHNFLNRQEAIVQYGHADFDAAKCRICQKAEESTFHLLSECDAFDLTRMLIWGEMKLTPPYNLKLKQILDFLLVTQIPSFKSILDYTVAKPI